MSPHILQDPPCTPSTLCVCVCVCACVRACVRAHEKPRMHPPRCMCLPACMRFCGCTQAQMRAGRMLGYAHAEDLYTGQ